MDQPEHSDNEIYRVIVLRRGGTELLVAPAAAGFSLPEVTISRWQRVAENLTAAMKEQWGEEVICLFQPDLAALVPAENQVSYQVAEHWRCVGRPERPTQWVSVEDLGRVSSTESCDYAAIQRSRAECGVSGHGAMAAPFAQVGWFKELYEWIDAEVEPKGLHLNGNFRQLNANPSFSLIRFETDGPAIWFKAVGEPNRREFPITLTLARLLPSYVPQVLAARPSWNGWIMTEVEGTNLGETRDRPLWEAAAAALARLQIECIATHRELVDCGAHGLRIEMLRGLVSPFMDVAAHLMEKQSKVPPAVLGKMELRLIEERIHEALSILEDLGIPDTLGHLDLNPGNIITSKSQCAFLDWAEAYIGQPFFAFQYLLEHFRRMSSADSVSEKKVVTSYLAPWEQVASRNCVEEAMVLTPLLAVFVYAAGTGAWMQPNRLSDPKAAGYLRSLVRRMNREANQLTERRSSCLS